MRGKSPYLDELTSENIKVKFDMTSSTPPVPKRSLKQPLFKMGATKIKDLPELKWLTQFLGRQLHVDADQIQFYPGSSQAFFQILAALTEPGDSVLIESPAYDPFLGVAQFLNLKVERFTRHPNGELDFAELEQKRDRIKVICLTNPHCPTGWLYSEKQIEKISKMFPNVVLDEVFMPLFNDGMLSTVPKHCRHNVITIGGLSKSSGLAYLRVGWSCAPKEHIQKIKTVGNLLHIAIATPSIVGAAHVYKIWKKHLRAINEQAVESRKLVRTFIKKHPGICTHDFAKGHFGLLEIPKRFKDARKFAAEILSEEGIYVRPCDQFEMPRHVRFSVMVPGPIMKRFLAAVEKKMN